MKNKKLIAAVTGVAAAVGITIGVVVMKFGAWNDENNPADIVTESPPPAPNIASPTLEPMNPTDYSGMKAGDTFFDDYWHGIVTIVGKEGKLDCTYQEFIDNSNGRLIATQDGMVIYVEEQEHEKLYDENAVQTGEDDTPMPEDDKAFYASPSVEFEGRKNIPNESTGRMFPKCCWAGLRYAAKQYLTDIGLNDVTTITVISSTTDFTSELRGFKCSMDNAEGELGVYFDTITGMWSFTCSDFNTFTGGKSYLTYNPVDFVAPSSRDNAKKELNEIVGYEKF